MGSEACSDGCWGKMGGVGRTGKGCILSRARPLLNITIPGKFVNNADGEVVERKAGGKREREVVWQFFSAILC